jgi:Ribosomal protein L10
MANKAIIAQKEAAVKALAEELKASKLILLIEASGVTVENDTKVRKSIREANGKCSVIKNNIIRRALDSNNESGLDDLLVGPTTLVMAEEDYLTPLKAVYKFSKENENYKIKGGIIEGKVMSVEEIITLAKLPSREELLSKLAGSLLQTISKVAVAIDQVRIKKESEEGAPAVEAKAEEAKPAEEPVAEEKAEETAPVAENAEVKE